MRLNIPIKFYLSGRLARVPFYSHREKWRRFLPISLSFAHSGNNPALVKKTS
jgi:hypothetical protein